MNQFAEVRLVDAEFVFQFRLEYTSGPGAELEQGENDPGVVVEERRGRDRLPDSPQVQEELGSGFPPGSHRGKCIPSGYGWPSDGSLISIPYGLEQKGAGGIGDRFGSLRRVSPLNDLHPWRSTRDVPERLIEVLEYASK